MTPTAMPHAPAKTAAAPGAHQTMPPMAAAMPASFLGGMVSPKKKTPPVRISTVFTCPTTLYVRLLVAPMTCGTSDGWVGRWAYASCRATPCSQPSAAQAATAHTLASLHRPSQSVYSHQESGQVDSQAQHCGDSDGQHCPWGVGVVQQCAGLAAAPPHGLADGHLRQVDGMECAGANEIRSSSSSCSNAACCCQGEGVAAAASNSSIVSRRIHQHQQ